MMLSTLFKFQLFGAFALLLSTGLTLSGDTQDCNAARQVPVGSLELAQMTTTTQWCCCGGCCGYARDCTAIPGCTSC